MNTDPIPEAREVAATIATKVKTWNELSHMTPTVLELINKACLSYHKRKLAECGDAREVAHAIQDGFKGAFSRGAIMGSNAIVDLINQHTAKAIQEREFLYEQNQPVARRILSAILEAGDGECSKLNAICSIIEQHTAKAVEEATKKLNEWYCDQRDARLQCCKDVATLQKQCEELRTRAEKTEAALKSEQNLPSQLLDVHAICQQRDDAVARANKAEAEVAALNALLTLPHEYCLACGGRGGHEEGCHGTTPLIALKAQLSTLQQDVKPLLAVMDQYYDYEDALATFLSKHPELGGAK